MWQNSLHPGFVEGQELILRHLACRHGELAVTALGHVADDRNVVGLIRENEPSNFTPPHEAMQDLRVGRVRACDPMRSQLKDIADLRDRRCERVR